MPGMLRGREMATTTRSDYQTWAEFRYQIRRYLHTAEDAARDVGLEPQQHQMLLAVCGFPGGTAPTISDLAERMQLRHNSVVELVDRMEHNGLVSRHPTGVGRAVAVKVTPPGRRALDAASRRLRPHLDATALQLIDALSQLSPAVLTAPTSRARRAPARKARGAAANGARAGG